MISNQNLIFRKTNEDFSDFLINKENLTGCILAYLQAFDSSKEKMIANF